MRTLATATLLGIMPLGTAAADTGGLGANYNEHFEDVDYRELDRANVEWLRMFVAMPEFDKGAASHGAITTTLAAAENGYKTVLSFKWPYPRQDFPTPGSAGLEQELKRLDAVLPLVMGKVDILVIGNEPYIESRKEDRDLDLNAFYEAMAARVIAYRKEHCAAGCKTRLYMGALNRLHQKAFRTPSAERWMEYVRVTPEIDGVDIHPHIEAIEDSQPFLDFILSRMRPDQKFLVTEFSLVWWWKKHLAEKAPAAFLEKYRMPKDMRVWQVIDAARVTPFSKAKWDDFLSMSPWFETRKTYVQDQMRLFNATGRLAVATYGFKQGSSMTRRFGPESTPWLLNSVYVPRTVQKNADGTAALNYAWIENFKAVQQAAAQNGTTR